MVESLDVNSQDFIVIWLDSNIYKTDYCSKHKTILRSCVKTVKAFENANECIDYIANHQDTTIFVMVVENVRTSDFIDTILTVRM